MATQLNFTSFTPTHLNMVGQMGIFRAGGRLGFWDSANSVSWSSLFAKNDFVPSITTTANYILWDAIVGRIVNILPQGDGFVVYSTKSIVGIRSAIDQQIRWEASSISDTAGIAYPTQVCIGLTDKEHFAFTSTGVKRIGNFNALNKAHTFEDIVTDVYDLLKESRTPVKLDLINGRFLVFSLIQGDYISGRASFTKNTIGDLEVEILVNGLGWDGITVLPVYISFDEFNSEGSGDPILVTTYMAGRIITIPTVPEYLVGWRATGWEMNRDQSTSIIDPYEMNYVSSIHVPNVPTTYPVLFTAGMVASILTTESYSGVPPHFLGESLERRVYNRTWGFQAPNKKVPYAYETQLGWTKTLIRGRKDKFLHEYVETQIEEWAAFRTNENVMLANFQAQAPIVGAAVALPAGSVLETAIVAYQNAQLASLGYDVYIYDFASPAPTPPAADPQSSSVTRVGNTVTTIELVTELYTGVPVFNPVEGVNAVTIDYGVHTELAGFHEGYRAMKTATFTEGYKIEKKVARVYSLTTPIVVSPVYYSFTQGNYGTPEQDNSGYIPHPIPAIVMEATQAAAYMDSMFWGTIRAAMPASYIYGNVRWQYNHTNAPTITFGIISYSPTTYGPIIGMHSYYDLYWVDTGLPIYSQEFTAGQFAYVIPAVIVPMPGYTETTSYIITPTTLQPAVYSLRAYQDWLDWDSQTYSRGGGDGGDSPFDAESSGSGSSGAYHIPATDIPGSFIAPPDSTFTYPGPTFLLQNGSIAPIYPTYVGALVLDLALKKWGKMKADYKALVDYLPINSEGKAITYSNFGVDMGILSSTGAIKLFDTRPLDSWLRYGKIGFYRLGETVAQEVRVHFRTASTGTITINTSKDGRSLEYGLGKIIPFTGVAEVVSLLGLAGRWHTIKISGNYDLQFLEFRGTIGGRR